LRNALIVINNSSELVEVLVAQARLVTNLQDHLGILFIAVDNFGELGEVPA
jgi:hypothetical protein